MSIESNWRRIQSAPRTGAVLLPSFTNILVGIARTFPVSVMVALPFALLIIPPAILNKNPETGFIFKVLIIALAATFTVELLIHFFKRVLGARRDRNALEVDAEEALPQSLARRYFIVAVCAILVGAIANNITALIGIGTIETQVGAAEAASGPVAGILTLMRPYDLIGSALLIWAYRIKGCSGRAFLFWFAFAIVAKLVYVLQLGITVQFWRYLSTFVFLLLFARLIRFRTIIAIGVAVAIMWPVLYEYRNAERELRGVEVVQGLEASDRLRYDLQVTRASGIETGQDIGQIQWYEVPRYGLIPGVLDPGRGPVNTGMLINSRILGGSEISAYTFLPVATSYVLQGPGGMALIYGFYAMFAAWIIDGGRYMGGGRFVTLGLFVFGALGWFYVFPDSAIAFLQSMITAIPIFVIITRRPKLNVNLRR